MNDPYGTNWAQAQHDADGGYTASLTVAHQQVAADLREHAGNLMPVAASQYLFATTGTDEDRRAAIDAWAGEHHVTAQWDDRFGYHAKVMFGPMAEVAVAVEQESAASYVARRVTAIKAGVAEVLAASKPEVAA